MTTISIYIDKNKPNCWYCSGGVYIKVWCPKQIECKVHQKTGFQCFKHTFWTRSSSCNLKFFIPSATSKDCYKCLKLFKNGNSGEQETIECKEGYNQVYVYFYEKDPRPLLFCYDGEAFVPRKGNYDKEWKKVLGVEKCVCPETGDDSECCKLLEELVKVVGFLNEVNLSMHPPGAGSNGVCNSGSTTDAGSETSTCTPSEGQSASNICTYEVHKYNGSKIEVRVKCEPVNGTQPPTTSGNSCYKKLTHQPAGLSGVDNGDNFRLGDVTYSNGSGGGPFKVPYYDNGGNRSEYWRQPLVKVTAYFYNEDKEYRDPLLVELQFKNGDGAGNVFEYYKLTKTASGSGNMTWAKDTGAKSKVEGNGDKLVKHLDEIRYDLKKVLRVELNKQVPYTINVKPGKPSDAGNGFEQIPNGDKKEVTVTDCTAKCAELSDHKYKCFQHKLTSLGADNLYKIGGVAFTIPGKNGQGVIEIKLFNGATGGPAPNCSKSRNGQPIDPITYNKCMGDVYVYFYDGTTAGVSSEVDTVPLMLWYDKGYYSPCDRDKYFEKWVQVKDLRDIGKPCGGGGGVNGLANNLNEVNKELNRIDLDPEKAKGTGYGLPETADSGIIPHPTQFPTIRVKLTRQEGPKQPTNNHAYVKIVHRTYNGFEIGAIMYNKKDFATDGVSINGASGGPATITVKNDVKSNGGHISLVAKHKWNTVVAYYSNSDAQKKLPQLIVVLNTDAPVTQSKPVTSVKDTGYGYYILSNKTTSGSGVAGGVNYEYVWRLVEKEQVTLDDATDIKLLNSAVILLNQRPKNGDKGTDGYGDDKISQAISSAKLSSPGRDGFEINRITDKEISVTDETAGTDTTGTAGKDSTENCLKDTGFKLITHDITNLVTIEGQLSQVLPNVSLIAGLRFLIPCKTKKDNSYQELKLSESSNSPDVGNSYLYYIHYQKSKHKVCGYFYGQDPRPLMLCYDGNAYRAQTMNDYFDKWIREKNITYCGCIDPSYFSGQPFLQTFKLIFSITVESVLKTLRLSERGAISKAITNAEELVKALVAVSNLLNPVNIKNVPTNGKETTYEVHEFKGEKITIKVELTTPSTETFCYNGYTHTHCGTSDCKSNGKGFRLGNIKYNGTCIQLNGTKGPNNGNCITSQLVDASPYTAASKVVVFYYKYDDKHQFPMVVAMGKTSNGQTMCKLFYVLVDKVDKKYEKKVETAEFNLDDDKEVTNKLDAALFSNSNHLQIIIDRIPMPRLYCLSNPGANNCPPVDCNKCDKCYQDNKALHDAQCTMIEKLKKNSKNNPGCVLLSAGKSLCYTAQLYKSDGSPLTNGTATTETTTPTTTTETTTPKTTSIQVTPVKCDQLSRHGYKCYVHELIGFKDIGGLRFFLWDNTKGDSAGSSDCGTGGSAICPAAGTDTKCRELCLYKDTSPDSSAGTSSCAAATTSPVPGQSTCTDTAPGETSLVKITTSYTTCKGNVYVYFYGDDPRPLMLCYDNNAYGPRCVEEYSCRWVCVASVPGCVVEVKDGKCTGLASEHILKALYDASMFLNPVRLGLTKCAFHHEGKTCPNGEKNGENGNGNGQAAQTQTHKDPYKYPIHKYKGTCVNVSIKQIDLSCYRRYTHAPMAGFRLGTVSYEETSTGDEGSNGASPQCPPSSPPAQNGCPATPNNTPGTSFCFPYCTSKQLIGVALYYYMYDKPHQYPLIVELQFKGEVSDYYRLVCTGGNKTWVKMVDPNDKDSSKKNNNNDDACPKDNQGSGTSCTDQSVQTCSKDADPTDKETCDLDAEFARNAKRIEEQILALNMANQVEQVEFMALTAELLMLIERRAYGIRKVLKLEYEPRDETTLIMETDKNCHEDSVLMYVLSGGAVGVAGGGTFYQLFTYHFHPFSKIPSITPIHS